MKSHYKYIAFTLLILGANFKTLAQEKKELRSYSVDEVVEKLKDSIAGAKMSIDINNCHEKLKAQVNLRLTKANSPRKVEERVVNVTFGRTPEGSYDGYIFSQVDLEIETGGVYFDLYNKIDSEREFNDALRNISSRQFQLKDGTMVSAHRFSNKGGRSIKCSYANYRRLNLNELQCLGEQRSVIEKSLINLGTEDALLKEQFKDIELSLHRMETSVGDPSEYKILSEISPYSSIRIPVKVNSAGYCEIKSLEQIKSEIQPKLDSIMADRKEKVEAEESFNKAIKGGHY